MVEFEGTTTPAGYLMPNVLYIYIIYSLVRFYGIQTLLGYLIVFVHTYRIHMICKLIVI